MDVVASSLTEEVLRLGKTALKKTVTSRVYVSIWTELMYMIRITRCNIVYQSVPIVPKVVARRVVFNTTIRLDDYHKVVLLPV